LTTEDSFNFVDFTFIRTIRHSLLAGAVCFAGTLGTRVNIHPNFESENRNSGSIHPTTNLKYGFGDYPSCCVLVALFPTISIFSFKTGRQDGEEGSVHRMLFVSKEIE
jgi:hypothetical protein